MNAVRIRWLAYALAGNLLLMLAPAWLGLLGALAAVALVASRRSGLSWRDGLRLLYGLTPGLLVGVFRLGRNFTEGLLWMSLAMLVWLTGLAGWESVQHQRRQGVAKPGGEWNPWAETGPSAQALQIALQKPARSSVDPAAPRLEPGRYWAWPDGWRLPATAGQPQSSGDGRWSLAPMGDQAGLWVIDHTKQTCWRLDGWQLAGNASAESWLEPVGGGSLTCLSEVLAQQSPQPLVRSGAWRWPRGALPAESEGE